MSNSKSELIEAIQQMPDGLTVAQIMAGLWDRFGPPDEDEEELTREEWEAAWAAELERRMKSVLDGTARGRPGDVVMRELKERFG